MAIDALREFGVVKNGVFIGPRMINVHVTGICNLNCLYCPFHSPRLKNERSWGHMPLSVFKRTIDDAASLHVESVIISGEGEPTAHPDINEILDYVKLRNIRFEVLTNGVFDKSVIKHIMGAGSVTINLSSLRYDRYRRMQSSISKASVTTPLRNIRVMAALKKKIGRSSPDIILGFIINNDNYDEVEDVLNFAAENNASIRFRLMKANRMTEDLIVSDSSVRSLRSAMERIGAVDNGRTNSKYILERLSSPDFMKKEGNADSNRVFYFDMTKGEVVKCKMGWYTSAINSNGDVVFCCQNQIPIGNLGDRSFADIWKSPEYARVRRMGRDGFRVSDPDWRECRHCPWMMTGKFEGVICHH